MDGIGVIICPNGNKFDVYRVKIADEKIIDLEPITEGRAKGYARKEAERELIRISQALGRGQVEFGEIEE